MEYFGEMQPIPTAMQVLKWIHWEPENISNIFNEIVSYGRANPFPGGSLSINMTPGIREQVILLLDQFGNQVHHLYLNVNEVPTVFMNLIKDCVQRTPNLKGLYIEGHIEPDTVPCLRVGHVPVLKNLEILHLKLLNIVPRTVARTLLVHVLRLPDHANQLKKLYLKVVNVASIVTLLPFCANLKELELVLETRSYSLQDMDIFNSPIETLTLDVSEMENETRKLYYGGILRIVQRLQGSLKSFCVIGPQEFQNNINSLIF